MVPPDQQSKPEDMYHIICVDTNVKREKRDKQYSIPKHHNLHYDYVINLLTYSPIMHTISLTASSIYVCPCVSII